MRLTLNTDVYTVIIHDPMSHFQQKSARVHRHVLTSLFHTQFLFLLRSHTHPHIHTYTYDSAILITSLAGRLMLNAAEIKSRWVPPFAPWTNGTSYTRIPVYSDEGGLSRLLLFFCRRNRAQTLLPSSGATPSSMSGEMSTQCRCCFPLLVWQH